MHYENIMHRLAQPTATMALWVKILARCARMELAKKKVALTAPHATAPIKVQMKALVSQLVDADLNIRLDSAPGPFWKIVVRLGWLCGPGTKIKLRLTAQPSDAEDRCVFFIEAIGSPVVIKHFEVECAGIASEWALVE